MVLNDRMDFVPGCEEENEELRKHYIRRGIRLKEVCELPEMVAFSSFVSTGMPRAGPMMDGGAGCFT